MATSPFDVTIMLERVCIVKPFLGYTCTFLLLLHSLRIFVKPAHLVKSCTFLLLLHLDPFMLDPERNLNRTDEVSMTSSVNAVLQTHQRVVEDGYVKEGALKYRSYAISTLRGGVGKSTLAFNLAFEMTAHRPMLVADLCPQCNLTETMLRDHEAEATIINVLQPAMLGPAFGDGFEDVSYRISTYCDSFKARKPAFLVPGSAEMFAFPSTMYQQLQIAGAQRRPEAVGALLDSVKTILNREAKEKKASGILMDTSPFYGGGTHLAWCAADAVIIPVRVDEHSIESLELTLDMMSNPQRDFMVWNERANRRSGPKVAAIVMTMVGSRSRIRSTPDRASMMYIERALEIVSRYKDLFDVENTDESIVITDDFVSAGRISGAEGIPISKLRVGKFHTVDGKRLQVNSSITRYQRELAYLVSIL